MLPVEEALPELLAALQKNNCAVLVAPPGAGKTTRVPPALLGAEWAGAGKVLLLSPRRIAARAAAARMASECGERAGETVGYRVRLDSKVSGRTRIEVVTEGVFTRLILGDPELSGVKAVIFDEFHERSVEGDLGLALARDAQLGLRADLKLLVMSATLDAARVSALLGDAPVVVSEGRLHPVRHIYRPRDQRLRLEEDVAAATRLALASEAGSALVFLPGMGEIERTAEVLRASVTDPSVEVRPLFGAMSSAEQDAAIAPAAPGLRKVVLATSIAETSLTIEGVRIVVDSGLARRPRFEPGLGLSRLETVRASQAAVAQRAGRAGRVEPGVCWRLWSEGETRALPAFEKPEILDADLSALALDLAAWGVVDTAQLVWLDPPPKPAWNEATALLKRLGALDPTGRLTDHGRAIAALPLPPRLAHMVIEAGRDGEAFLAARIAMVLTEQGLGGRDVDLRTRLHRFAHERGQRAQAARALAQRVARSVSEGGSLAEADEDRAGAVLALAYPDRIGKARGASYSMVNGRAASIEEVSALAREPYLVIADIAGSAGKARVLLAAPISVSDVEMRFCDQIEVKISAQIDPMNGAVRARRVRTLGRMVLSETPAASLSSIDLQRALCEAVREQGLQLLDWEERAVQLRARVGLLRDLDGDGWPDWSDAALIDRMEDWLEPALGGVKSLREARVAEALLATLPYETRRRLDAAAPERFATPAGSSLLIDYAAEGGPTLSVRLQELFGLDKHPSVADGRAPLTLSLLSPAHRPVQTTRDLPGFWRGSYAGVRTEMRGRYPRHPWPEDPLTAAPTRRAKPRVS